MPRFEEYRAHVDAVIAAVRRRCDPFDATLRALDEAPLTGPVFVVGAGKGSVRMAGAAVSRLGDLIIDGVIAAVPEAIPTSGIAHIRVLPADHPLPTERNLTAAGAIRDMALRASEGGPDATLVVLLSGGASAHVTLPMQPLELRDMRVVTGALLRAGAPIEDLNCIRKHCEALKGGRLALLAAPARVAAFIVSDVIGDRTDIIASGPTSPDRTTYADALDVLRFHRVMEASPGVARFLEAGERGEQPETPKPGHPLFECVRNAVIASNADAVMAAKVCCVDAGFGTTVLGHPMRGEAKEYAKVLAHSEGALGRRPVALIMGGETTVAVGSAMGRGGRNQELALATAIEIDGRPNIVIATFATDGIDGPTDAAGAIVTGQTCAQARALGLDPARSLSDHDSYAFFDALTRAGRPHLIRTGPTGTNVDDLALALVY